VVFIDGAAHCVSAALNHSLADPHWLVGLGSAPWPSRIANACCFGSRWPLVAMSVAPTVDVAGNNRLRDGPRRGVAGRDATVVEPDR